MEFCIFSLPIFIHLRIFGFFILSFNFLLLLLFDWNSFWLWLSINSLTLLLLIISVRRLLINILIFLILRSAIVSYISNTSLRIVSVVEWWLLILSSWINLSITLFVISLIIFYPEIRRGLSLIPLNTSADFLDRMTLWKISVVIRIWLCCFFLNWVIIWFH